MSFRGLSDVCLALNLDRRVVGNDANADKKGLVIVTGANQGSKSTFLRSVGLAQLMMQWGMFVSADYYGSSVCDIFVADANHFEPDSADFHAAAP
jgi:DNA mismatch repair ATPase MutS